MLCVLLTLAKIGLKRYYFIKDKKSQMVNSFFSRKLFQRRPKKADLALLKAKWQP
jgi:hypothetical protein